MWRDWPEEEMTAEFVSYDAQSLNLVLRFVHRY